MTARIKSELAATNAGERAGSRATIEREALLRVAAAAAAANDLPRVLELAAEEALQALGASSLAISRFEDGHSRYRPLINVGQLAPWETRFPEDEVYDVSHFPGLLEMVRTGRPNFTRIDDPGSDRAAVELLQSLGRSSDLEVAIVVEGQVWGGLWVSTTTADTRYDSDDVRFLEAVGGQLGGAIARAELFAKVSRLAYEDSLTGLANRRAFDERLDRAIGRFAAGEAHLAVLLCDVDGLKRINDGGGHGAGDEALRSVGHALVAAAAEHPGAFVARVGGDEFCVLLEDRDDVADGEEHHSIESLGTSAQRLLEGGPERISMSCGVAAAGPGTATAGALLGAADAAQYVAKRRGGNRICTATGAAESTDGPVAASADTGTDAEKVAAVVESVVGGLAGDLAVAPALDRLEFVATRFTEAWGFARWTISFAGAGTDYLRDLSLGDNRHRRGEGMLVARTHQDLGSYMLDDYPLTDALIRAGTGSFVAEAGDDESDPAERELLEADGYAGVVGAVAGTEEGAYLLEIFSDERGSPLRLARSALALAVQAALPPVPYRRTAASPVSSNSALLLSIAIAERLSGATAEREVCECAVEEAQKAFGCSIVHLVAIAGDRLDLRAEHGRLRAGRTWQQAADAGLIGLALRERRAVVARDVRREPQYRGTEVTRDVRSELVAPILVGGEPWGAINLEDTKLDGFSGADARLLESVAAQVGGALTAIRLYERLDRAYIGTAEALSQALEAKDSYTARHSRSIAECATAVGERMGMNGEELRMLRYAAAFHDIGKLSISRELLNKPGALSGGEWAEIEQHTIVGERILASIDFLAPIRPIVRSAHERWDGGGYPDGLVGEAIPLGARILFACDAYDAMTTDRSYRAAMSAAEAREELGRCAGSQFDPGIVDALLTVLDQGAGSPGVVAAP